MPLTGPQRQQLWKALLNAYENNQPGLRRMLNFTQLLDLSAINWHDTLENIVFELILRIQADGHIERLIVEARNDKPDNTQLRAVAELLLLACPVEPVHALLEQEKLQKRLLKSVEFMHAPQWRQQLGRRELTVCRLEAPEGTGIGTAFLVGPSLVMTNQHVMDEVRTRGYSAREVVLRFDYKSDVQGLEVQKGQTYRLADDWHRDSSTETELDYALLRVNGAPGEDAVGGQDGAPMRHWLTPRAYTFEPGEPLFILQHPQARPLQIAPGVTQSVDEVQKRVLYTVLTDYGSSGAPCFNSAMELVALHRSGGAQANRGVLFSAILARLQENGKLVQLGGDFAAVVEPRS
jgi:hypothetical protein